MKSILKKIEDSSSVILQYFVKEKNYVKNRKSVLMAILATVVIDRYFRKLIFTRKNSTKFVGLNSLTVDFLMTLCKVHIHQGSDYKKTDKEFNFKKFFFSSDRL